MIASASHSSWEYRKIKRAFYLDERIDEISESSKDAYIKFLENLINSSNLFDKDYYLSKNKDVKRAGADPLRHYLLFGGREGRSPSEQFDGEYYLRMHPKIHELKINPLVHYLKQCSLDPGYSNKDFSVSAKKTLVRDFKNKLLADAKNFDNLVFIESMPWEGALQQRPHHLARLLSEKGVLVIYIDKHVHELPKRISSGLYVVHDDSYIKLIGKSTVSKKYWWLFSTTPIKNKTLKGILSLGYELIYDFIDDFDETISGNITNQLENFKNLKSLKPKILIVSAKKLLDELQKNFPNSDILMCPNGVDITHFDYELAAKNHKIPTDLVGIYRENKPIIGYYGAVAPWLDYKLINELTQRRKDLSFVFIGVDYGDALAQLDFRDNVHFLGAKDYKTLPQYSYWFDCAIIPFKKGNVAKATSPVKLYEYMAMGLPVVCTRDLEECRGFEYVYISQNEREFENNINLAIKLKSKVSTRKKIIGQAKANTWEVRVDQVINKITELSKES